LPLKNGYTSLHKAAGFGEIAVVKYLVEECEAMFSTQGKNGRTPRDVAKYWRQFHVAHYLQTRELMKVVLEIEWSILPFYNDVRKLIVQYLTESNPHGEGQWYWQL